MTQQHSISIAFQTNKPITAYGSLATAAEGYGFDGVSVYNDLLYQPAWLPLLEMARQTRRVRLGVAAANPFTCHPVNIAGNISLIDEASQGRAYLGLARGGWLDFLGLEPARPVTALREAFECIRHLLSGSKNPYPGEIFPLAGGESLRWPVFRPDIPFLLGTWGAKTIHACLPYIREIKIGGTANPGVVPQIPTTLADSAQRIGRDPTEIGVVVGAVTVVDEDGQAARRLARREAALYVSIIAQLDHSLGLEPELLSRINEASARYDYEGVGSYISDALLRRLAFAGTPDEVVAQAVELFQAGADRVEFGTPHGLDEQEGLRLLGERVLPALRAYLDKT
ncbi:MAG: LLM class flavin-dependent oxidoreductase [Chloroflexi bacterium]|nr:LLM class flavin-dependent oxidoreductase [Chloroflexota bacterium]